jgi:hypothetical protein
MCGNDSYRTRVHTGSRCCCHTGLRIVTWPSAALLQINESEADSAALGFLAVVVRADLINSMAHCLS